MISIITINYNNKIGLERTIQSVQNQTAINFEHIIIDGDSTDGSKDVILVNKDSFSYWVSEADLGIYNAMNKGIKVAKGDYLLFLNSGDTLHNDTIIEELSKHCLSGLDLYYGDLNNVNGQLNKHITFPNNLSFGYFYNGGYLPHPATLIKSSLFDTLNLYNEDYKIIADWDFFINAICKYNASYKHVDLIVSNFDTTGVSNQEHLLKLKLKEKQKSLKLNFPLFLEEAKRLKEYDDLFNLNRFKSLKKLEYNRTANKLNTIWLSLMSFFFKTKD